MDKTPRRYKDDFMNDTYWGFIRITNPNRVNNSGACDVQFIRGFRGEKESKFSSGLSHAAYMAGKEWHKQKQYRNG